MWCSNIEIHTNIIKWLRTFQCGLTIFWIGTLFFFQESFLALEIFLINVSLCLNDFFCLFVLVCSAVVRPAILQLQPPQPFCVEFPCTPSGCMGSLHSATVQRYAVTPHKTEPHLFINALSVQQMLLGWGDAHTSYSVLHELKTIKYFPHN